MSYLFFIDESGHDHKNCPYEVRGGIVIHAANLWSFIQQFRALEIETFGVELADFGVELKGSHLLDKKRFKFSKQGEILDHAARRKHAKAFLHHGQAKSAPSEIEFRAYGQACIEMARGVFRLLSFHESKIFAAVIPRSTKKPKTFQAEEYLRKDQVFLFERYYNFVFSKSETGLLVFDETDRSADRSFIRQIEGYFTKTTPGQIRAKSIVPVPMFVNSDLTKAIQAADVCIYALNWGFRGPKGMNAEVRSDIAGEFSGWITNLQASDKMVASDKIAEIARPSHRWYGVVFVPDPFGVGNA